MIGSAPRRPLHIGVILFGDLTFDSRVRREARSLALAGHTVSIVCLADAGDRADLAPNVRVVICEAPDPTVLPGGPNPFRGRSPGRIRRVATGMRWLFAYARNLRAWGRLANAALTDVDVWHAHDLTALAAIAPTTTKPVVYDTHELYLETGTALRLPGPARRLLARYERHLVRRAAAVVTVNEELAGVLRRRYAPPRIVVVHNCPDAVRLPATPSTELRAAAGVGPEAKVILHHGSLGPGRGIEQLIDALREPRLASAHLVLLGFGVAVDRYSAAGREGPLLGRVHVLPPVAPAVLLGWISGADVGGMPIQKSTMNLFLSTPNKMFECLAAGVPVVASDFPGMRRVLDDPGGVLGAVCDPTDVPALANAMADILDLPDDARLALRARCAAAARDRWNWQHEASRLLELYASLS